GAISQRRCRNISIINAVEICGIAIGVAHVNAQLLPIWRERELSARTRAIRHSPCSDRGEDLLIFPIAQAAEHAVIIHREVHMPGLPGCETCVVKSNVGNASPEKIAPIGRTRIDHIRSFAKNKCEGCATIGGFVQSNLRRIRWSETSPRACRCSMPRYIRANKDMLGIGGINGDSSDRTIFGSGLTPRNQAPGLPKIG